MLRFVVFLSWRREYWYNLGGQSLPPDDLRVLADFCAARYPTVNRGRWIDNIAGVRRDEGSPKSGGSSLRLIGNKKQQKTLVSLLRQLRMDAGLRQIDISKALGKRQAFVGSDESGATRLNLLEVRKVCEVLGSSLGVFVGKFEKKLVDASFPALSTSARPPRRLPGRRPKQQSK